MEENNERRFTFEYKKVKRDKRSHKNIKEENRIQINYKIIKIINKYLLYEQNYNSLKKL